MRKLAFSLLSETVVDLPHAARLLGVPPPTIVKWAASGLRGAVLETEYSPQRRAYVTSEEALGRFLEVAGWVTD